MHRIGLQTYTIRERMSTAEDCCATLRAVREQGYDFVQLYGRFPRLEQEANACREVGMPVIGTVITMDMCDDEPDRLISLLKTYGMTDISVSSSVKTEEETLDFIRRCNAFAERAVSEGLTFSYHNHSTEFVRTECGKTVMQLMLEGFSEKVNYMPDTYWIQDGGFDVRHFLELTAGKYRHVHLKDMKKVDKTQHTFAPLGEGNLWLPGIINTALAGGADTFIVEQDICEEDQLLCAEKSIAYLRSLNLL